MPKSPPRTASFSWDTKRPRKSSRYHSLIATISLQTLFRGVRGRNKQIMYGLSVNRRPDAPRAISEAGLDEVKQDPNVLRLTARVEEIQVALRLKYRSLAAACRATEDRVQDAKKAIHLLAERRKSLILRIYSREYQAHFQEMTEMTATTRPSTTRAILVPPDRSREMTVR